MSSSNTNVLFALLTSPGMHIVFPTPLPVYSHHHHHHHHPVLDISRVIIIISCNEQYSLETWSNYIYIYKIFCYLSIIIVWTQNTKNSSNIKRKWFFKSIELFLYGIWNQWHMHIIHILCIIHNTYHISNYFRCIDLNVLNILCFYIYYRNIHIF